MKLTKSFLNNLSDYLYATRRPSGIFKSDDWIFAHNNASVIIFDDGLNPFDFGGLEVKDGNDFVKNVGKYILDPYMKEAQWEYDEGHEISMSDIDLARRELHTELDLPLKEKLYGEDYTRVENSCCFNGMWIVPDLLYDVGRIISTPRGVLELYIPKNKRYPAVVIGENRAGRHYGFVLGTMKNFRKDE